jgi:hypothetical protein
MIDPQMLIYSLVGIVVLLSMLLAVKVVRSRPKKEHDPWGSSTPVYRSTRTRAPKPMVIPPPPQMFRQR